MTPTITPSTCSKRPSLAAVAVLSISAASRSPTFGDVLLRWSSASTSAAPGGTATRAVGVARVPGGRAASRSAGAGGPGAEGGGAGGGEGGGDGAAREAAGFACRSLESDSSSSAPLSLWGGARATTPGSAAAALGGGGSCVTSGTPSSGTDLMSRIDSPRRIPAVPSAPDFLSTGVSGLGTTGSRPPKSSGEATGPRCAAEVDGGGPAGGARVGGG